MIVTQNELQNAPLLQALAMISFLVGWRWEGKRMSMLWTHHLKCQGGSGWLCVYVYVCVCTVYIYLHCVYLSIYLSANTGCAWDVYLISRQFLPSI